MMPDNKETKTASDVGTKTLSSYIIMKEDPAKKVRDAYEIAKNATTKRRETWKEIYEQYHGYISKSAKKYKRANFHFHKIFPQIEMEAARFITGYFSHTPFVGIRPGGSATVEMAKQREDTQQYYYKHCPNFYLSTLRLIKHTLLYGSGFRVPSWRTIKRKAQKPVTIIVAGQEIVIPGMTQEVEETVYDGIWYDNFSPSEVFPDPYGTDIDNCRYVIVEEWVDANDLMERAKAGAYDLGRVQKIPLNMSGQDDREFALRAQEMGYEKPPSDEGIIRLQHYFADDHFITMANDETIIRDIDNFLEHKKKPIIQGMKTIDTDSFWPVGSARNLMVDQKLINLFVNMSAETAVSSNYPIWWYRKGGSVDPNHLISVPNQRIPMSDPEDAGIIQMPEMKQDLLALKMMVEQNMEEITGYFGPQKGYSQTRHTATSDSLFMQSGDKRINYDVMTFENCTLLPEAKQIGSMIEQFMPEELEVQLSGPGTGQFIKMTPEMFRGEYIYRVSGISAAINRSLQRQQLLELAQIGASMQQFVRMQNGMIAPVPLQDNYYALKEVYEAFDRQDAENMLIRPEVFGEPLNNTALSSYPLPAIPGQEDLNQHPLTGALRNRPWETTGLEGANEMGAMKRSEREAA